MNDPCTPYEERAAILEFCAGYTRAKAEEMARGQTSRAGHRETCARARDSHMISTTSPTNLESFEAAIRGASVRPAGGHDA